MQSRHSTTSERFVRHGLLPLSVAALIGFGACDDTDPMQTTTGPITTPGGLTGGVAAGTGAAAGTAAGGATGAAAAGGTAAGAVIGGAAAGGARDAGVAAPTGGGGTTAGLPGGGAPAGAGSGGATTGGGRADGGAADAGVGAGDAAVAPGTDAGGGGAGGCTRELLQSTLDKFFVALAMHNASMLPLAANAKFTENGETLPMGMGGLWQTAGMLKYQHSALDVQTCNVVSEAVVPESGTDLPVGVRLKLADGKVSEIELIVVRAGDYTVFGSPFPSSTRGISDSASTVKWMEPVAAAERTPRAEIERWLNKYFKMFSRGGCNFAEGCQRRENGGGNFACSAALTCAEGEPPAGRGTFEPRLFVVDEELGIGVGFIMFMGHTDFHMVKVRGGKIYAVHAILSAASGPGWP
jgi:hypothetical protein